MGFAENLYRLRKQKGLTQQELADILHIKRSNIGMYETNKRSPLIKDLRTFADFFHVDMNALITGGGTAHPLTPDETAHLTKYRRLDNTNRTKLDGYLDGLLDNQKAEDTALKKDAASSA